MKTGVPRLPFFLLKWKKGNLRGDILAKKKSETTRKKIKLGAPSEYKPEYCQKMINYFRDFVDEGRRGMPEFIEFALMIGVSDATLRNWRDNHKSFAEAYSICKSIQCWYLQQMGLSGKNNPRMTQFLLSANFKVAEYSRRKPEDEKIEEGLNDGDIELLRRLEERLKNPSAGARLDFGENAVFGEIPYGDNEGGADGASGD